jgi:L-ribulose-5-phosphate 4-epimerase
MSELRDEVCWGNKALPVAGLVTMHSGNVSGIDRERNVVLIKPSGIDYDVLTPADVVEVDAASGDQTGEALRPSVDLPHHLYLYRHLPEIGAVVHTHSNFATAFAAVGRSIPVCLTAIADEFGGDIPCAPYVDNVGEHIGEAIVAHRTRAPGILLGSHGVFAWGDSVRSAVKAAVMIEDVARTVWYALQIGEPVTLPAAEIEKWHGRYVGGGYGQPDLAANTREE